MTRRRLTLLAIAAALVLAAASRAPAGRAAANDKAGSIDATTCANCHDERVAVFAHNAHSVLDTKGLAERAGATFSCAACHGDVSKHVEENGGAGSIFAFGGKELASVKTQRCLTCHADVHPNFRHGPHGKAGMSCTDCHSIHSSDPGSPVLLQPAPAGHLIAQRSGTSAVCAECHGDIVARFRLNEHHRLQEGILECTSCHNPHDVQTRTLLGGFKQEDCATCHADKTGPYVYEHASVRVEGCVACHDPHGSVNRHQLKFQSEGELCLSCHNALPSFHSRFTLETNCTNCHTSIHGSNFSPFFLQ
jgi:DmsE family decaheme c-type cytochrome